MEAQASMERRRMQYRHPQPKNLNNSPDRAPGMKPFEVDGMTIYAGTMKGAIKKARLLKHQPKAI